MVMGEEVAVPVAPPGHATATYEVIAPPPMQAGAVTATEIAQAETALAVPIVGAFGTLTGL